MFSTAKVSSGNWLRRLANSGEKPRAYSRCHVKGGCTTTVVAATSRASSAARRSRTAGFELHTRCVTSRHGAWMDRTGTP